MPAFEFLILLLVALFYIFPFWLLLRTVRAIERIADKIEKSQTTKAPENRAKLICSIAVCYYCPFEQTGHSKQLLIPHPSL